MSLTEEEIDTLRASLNSRQDARDRLRQAGRRARDAETMRRAAIAEMGQALRDNRDCQKELGTSTKASKIDMEDAEHLTGVTRRTLSGAAGADYPGGRNLHCMPWQDLSDRDLAAAVRDSADDGYDAEEELHRRYPVLAGLTLARKAVHDAAVDRWRDDHPDELFEPLEAGLPPAWDDITRVYTAWIRAIAEGRPIPEHQLT
ncbi:hypothetical protein [Streptomyces noursei]|uniref:hypothetical protein n=1 Tax=Streptomyces noursei TaxID=1971 RepID=UPI0023B809B1|nr:hypothetical protein [Streptomyces noursei]